jgi:hypothetical protein
MFQAHHFQFFILFEECLYSFYHDRIGANQQDPNHPLIPSPDPPVIPWIYRPQ